MTNDARPAERACVGCRFYQPAGPNRGECRVNPPVRQGGEDDPADFAWPIVLPESWCGHWQPAAASRDGGEPRCGRCRHWHATHDDQGECRRYPPAQLSDGEDGTINAWPLMLADEGCGEFQPAARAAWAEAPAADPAADAAGEHSSRGRGRANA